MSSAYHPQTDGASEWTNKTVIQCIRFAVERHQKGWSRALDKIRFDLMNTTNASTGFTPFQLRFGKSPRLLPPILQDSGNDSAEERSAAQIIEQMKLFESMAQDNLLEPRLCRHTAQTSSVHYNSHSASAIRLSYQPYINDGNISLGTKHVQLSLCRISMDHIVLSPLMRTTLQLPSTCPKLQTFSRCSTLLKYYPSGKTTITYSPCAQHTLQHQSP